MCSKTLLWHLAVLIIRFRHCMCFDMFMSKNSIFTLFSVMLKWIEMMIKSLRNSSYGTENKKLAEKNEEKFFVNSNLSRNSVKFCSDLHLYASQATASQTFSWAIVHQWWEWQLLLTEPVLLDNKRALPHSVHNCVPFVHYGLEMYGLWKLHPKL